MTRYLKLIAGLLVWVALCGFGGQGGNGGGGGGTAVTPQQYGALGQGAVNYDGVVTSGATVSSGNSSGPGSTTPSALTVTTPSANNAVLSIYGFGGPGTFTPPVGPTQQQNVPPTTGYGISLSDQIQAAAGATGAINGSLSSSASWTAINIALRPLVGQTIANLGGCISGPSAGTSGCNQNSGGITTSIDIKTPSAASTNGRYEIMCVSYIGLVTINGGTSAFGQLAAVSAGGGATNNKLYCGSRTTSSEPSHYTVTFAGGNAYSSGFIAVYSNIESFNVSSATAAFTSAMTGWPICMSAEAFAGGSSGCGTMTYQDANDITVSMNGLQAATGVELRYAHDDSAAFTAALSALSTGGTLAVPIGNYGLTTGFTIPPNVVLNIQCAGAALTEQANGGTGGAGTQFTPVPGSGSQLWFLTTSLSSAGFTYLPNTVDTWQWVPWDTMSNCSLWAGAGHNRDGGGADGIDVFSQHTTIDHVAVSNFKRDGIRISDNNGVTGTYTALDQVQYSYLTYNGANGLNLTGSGNFNQQVYIGHDEIDLNGTYGVHSDLALDGAIFDDDIVQWNNQSGLNPGFEYQFFAACNGCSIRGGWIEDEKANTNGIFVSSGVQGPDIHDNYFFLNHAGTYLLGIGGSTGVRFTGNVQVANALPILGGAGVPTLETIDASNICGSAGSCLGNNQSGTAGTSACYENIAAGYTTVSCYLNGYANTGAAQTWTFPIPFSTTPINSTTSSSCGTFNPTATATVLTLPADAAMTAETCDFTMTGR